MRQHDDLLNFAFQKSSDSSNQLFRFAFVNTGGFVNGGGCGYMCVRTSKLSVAPYLYIRCDSIYTI